MLRRLFAASAMLAMLFTGRAQAQNIPPPAELVKVAADPVQVNAGASTTIPVSLTIASGWHINANPASPDYMVPTEVSLAGEFGLTPGKPKYPAPESIKLGFEENPVHVWSGVITIEVPVAAAASAVNGRHEIRGTVRFQACNDQLCLTPAKVLFAVAVEVSGGAAKPVATGATDSAASGTPTAGATGSSDTTSGGMTASGEGGTPPALATFDSRAEAEAKASKLTEGGIGAFLWLFGLGLLLNLTPCVYPMLGVTLALFGTRRAAPPAQVFGLALVYVLGMATMYSTLGVVAALTGKLFGSFMQNPVVLIGIGVLLAAMALSMFGVYEIQMPAALRERAAAVKTTNLLGIFLTGLFVGIFAAPCIAAPIVGVLTVVASRADPLYGFQTFFTLAMGLGAPYLVLGVFSNLLQKLPRSGEWMEWVKKVFGVVMIALALRFVSLGVAPNLTPWIVPVALVVGGTWLGFINRQAERVPAFKAFKRIGGAAAVIGGLAMVAMSPRNSLPMETFSPAALDAARSRGQVVMVDFSADWCVPCHELERYTLSDWRVIERAKTFAAFKADLTHDSPETQAWTERFAITGVPTVLFITPDGREVPGTRVQGFMPAKDFLERMTVAAQAGQRAAEVR